MEAERAELGIDGNAAFALLGEDLQVGESEWVELPPGWTATDEIRELYTRESRAAGRANMQPELGRERAVDLSDRHGVHHAP